MRAPSPLQLALTLVALVVTPLQAAEKIWFELATPSEGDRLRGPVGLVEVRGWAGTGLRGGHDVLIAIDRSLSVWEPSGSDIDGDGRVGARRGSRTNPSNHAFWTTDAGDTIFQAELAATRKLIERLDPQTTRMGILAFGGRAKVLAPLGSSDAELLDALDRLPGFADFSGTHFYLAFKRALEAFDSDPKRHRAIILLSDGLPTVPAPLETAEAFSIVGAKRAAEMGVRIFAFAVGPEAISEPRVFQQMAKLTDGELFLIDQPVDVIDYVPHLSLTDLTHVSIDNLSSSQRARAVRLFPDGSFDGYAPLEPGDNRLRITFHAEGSSRSVDRVVHYQKAPAKTAGEKAAAQRLLKDLRLRTLEMELSERIRRKRREQLERRLEIEVEPTP